jgi:hypothetical protein
VIDAPWAQRLRHSDPLLAHSPPWAEGERAAMAESSEGEADDDAAAALIMLGCSVRFSGLLRRLHYPPPPPPPRTHGRAQAQVALPQTYTCAGTAPETQERETTEAGRWNPPGRIVASRRHAAVALPVRPQPMPIRPGAKGKHPAAIRAHRWIESQANLSTVCMQCH